MKALKIALVAGTALMGASVAHADPISLYYSFDGVNYSVLPGTTTTTNGLNSTPLAGSTVTDTSGHSFGVQFTVTGSGSSLFGLSEPGFDTQTISVSAATGGLLYLSAIETGLTNTNLYGFTVGYTNNFGSTVSVGERFLVGQTLLPSSASASAVTMAPNTASSAFVLAPVLTSGYSIGERYRIDFGTSAGQVNATISERGVVPEPVSIALLGTGLVGLGIIRRKRS